PQIRNLVLYPAELRDRQCGYKRFHWLSQPFWRYSCAACSGFRDADPIGYAVGEGIVVEVVSRIVEAGRIAIACKDECSRPRDQHVREVFTGHERTKLGIDL